MKKFAIILVSIFGLAVVVIAGIWANAYRHNKRVNSRIKLIRVGMSQQQVTGILGRPVKRHMTDGPGEIWCYTIYPFDDYDENCGSSITMTPEYVSHIYRLETQ